MSEEKKIPSKRYVKLMFSGYVPVDLAVQVHLIGKQVTKNTVAEDMSPYEEYTGKYEHLRREDCTKED